MKLLKKLLAATVAASALAVPAVARVEKGTPGLIETAIEHGMSFQYNTERCNSGSFHGSYHGRTRTITLCYQMADAEAHDTVRHEIWHGIQHCAADKRGSTFLPVASSEDLMPFVESQLTPGHISRIKRSYPKDAWLTEFEAFAAAEAYTAEQMSELVRGWCG